MSVPWPTMDVARVDLRLFLADGPTDRPVKSKQVVGPVNGINATFLTWEDRLVEDTLFVTVNGQEIAGGDLDTVDYVFGKFTFPANQIPPANLPIHAAYYFQYFLDEDLDAALLSAVGQLTSGSDPAAVPHGLHQAALNFAGYFAYSKQAMKWAQRMSDRFILQEQPLDSDAMNRSNMFRSMANDMAKVARDWRDDYYKGQGRRETPAWAVFKPYVPRVGPRA
jgi:hypothetical protein